MWQWYFSFTALGEYPTMAFGKYGDRFLVSWQMANIGIVVWFLDCEQWVVKFLVSLRLVNRGMGFWFHWIFRMCQW
jgi:hypothetical protein